MSLFVFVRFPCKSCQKCTLVRFPGVFPGYDVQGDCSYVSALLVSVHVSRPLCCSQFRYALVTLRGATSHYWYQFATFSYLLPYLATGTRFLRLCRSILVTETHVVCSHSASARWHVPLSCSSCLTRLQTAFTYCMIQSQCVESTM